MGSSQHPHRMLKHRHTSSLPRRPCSDLQCMATYTVGLNKIAMDRPFNDMRYAIDLRRLQKFSWQRLVNFKEAGFRLWKYYDRNSDKMTVEISASGQHLLGACYFQCWFSLSSYLQVRRFLKSHLLFYI